MRKLILTAMTIGFLGPGIIIQQDPALKNRTNIKSESGALYGYIQPDPVFPDKLNLYDRGGKLKGYIKQDPMDRDRWKFEREGRGDHHQR
jgi:hypothetical protein